MFHFVPGARSENPRGKCWWCCIPWDGGKPQTLGFFTPLLEPFKRGWIWDPRDIPTSEARLGRSFGFFFSKDTDASSREPSTPGSTPKSGKMPKSHMLQEGPGSRKPKKTRRFGLVFFVLMFLRDSKQVICSSSSCSFFFAPFSSGVLIGMKAVS